MNHIGLNLDDKRAGSNESFTLVTRIQRTWTFVRHIKKGRENRKLFRQLRGKLMVVGLYVPFMHDNDNTKPFFKHVKNLRGNENGIHSVEISPGVLLQDSKKIADSLNNYLNSVFSVSAALPTFY